MKIGIVQMTMPEYLGLKALSSGLLHTLLTQSPYHAKAEQDGEREDDASEFSDTGTAIHDGLLEGLDRIVSVDAKDWRTNAAKAERDAARAAGKIPMLAHKVENVEAAVKAAKAYIAASELKGVFDSGKPEQTLLWEENGILCKARADWLSDEWHVSVKTTAGSANPHHYTRHMLSQQGHDTGLAFYERGMEALGLKRKHRILLIEQAHPHGCCVFGLAPSKHELVMAKVDRAIRSWQECVKRGAFPAYPTETCFAEAQPWEVASEEETQLSDAYDALQAKEGLQI